MPPIDINEQSFEPTIIKEGIVLLDWWAEWCMPCRMFAPIFAEAAAKHPDITFGKVDTEAQPDLAAAFQISSIPTLMVFRDGVLLFRQAGALPEEMLEALIAEIRSIDMEEVRKKIAEREAKTAKN
jgi:thioredoxin 1